MFNGGVLKIYYFFFFTLLLSAVKVKVTSIFFLTGILIEKIHISPSVLTENTQSITDKTFSYVFKPPVVLIQSLFLVVLYFRFQV